MAVGIQRPPIPQAPLVDPDTGYVTREWWRWFASIGVFGVNTATSITQINNNITQIIEDTVPPGFGEALDVLVPTSDLVALGHELRPLPDQVNLKDLERTMMRFAGAPATAVDLGQAALQALELHRPADPVDLDQAVLKTKMVDPQDPVDGGQIAMLAQFLRLPDDLPSARLGSFLVAGPGWRAGNLISANPNYPNAAKYTPLSTDGGLLLEIVAADGIPPRMLLNGFDNSGGNNAFPTSNFRYARGTALAPTAAQTGDILATMMGAAGYGATNFNANSVRFRAIATENFDDTHAGTYILVQSTPAGGTVITDTAAFKATGCWFLGTNTNDSKSAGQVGEYVFAEGAGTDVNMTSTTPADLKSINLTPGCWEVWGVAAAIPAATTVVTLMKAWISTSSATNTTFPNGGAIATPISAAGTTTETGESKSFPVGMKRLSLNTTTTVYISGRMDFTVSTATMGGAIYARRVD